MRSFSFPSPTNSRSIDSKSVHILVKLGIKT
jgi:hypothetical protein